MSFGEKAVSGKRPADGQDQPWTARFYCRHEGKGATLVMVALRRGELVTANGDASGLQWSYATDPRRADDKLGRIVRDADVGHGSLDLVSED